MGEEINSMLNLGVWSLEKLPSLAKTVKSGWVYKQKEDEHGNVTRYKSRLVAKGYSQVRGVNYFIAYSPVVKADLMRLALSISCYLEWPIPLQLDVSTAFLNADLDCVIWMEIPPGFHHIMKSIGIPVPETHGYALKLHKAIYGLVQSSRLWNKKLSSTLATYCTQSKFDECIWLKHDNNDILQAIVLVFVDDLVICAATKPLQECIRKLLERKFKCTYGPINYVLGVKVTYNLPKRYVEFSIEKYINDMHDKFSTMVDKLRKTTTPAADGIEYTKYGSTKDTNGQVLASKDIKLYQSVVGCLMYAVQAGRPDISNATYGLACYLHCPTDIHLLAAFKTVKFLVDTKSQSLRIDCSTLHVRCYTDANWAGKGDARSISGYAFVFGKQGSFATKCKKQPSIALSSAESETISLAMAAAFAAFIKSAMEEIFRRPHPPIPILCDNQAAIYMAQSCASSERNKHINIRYYFIKDLVHDKIIELYYIKSADNPADLFTKNLGKMKYHRHALFILGHSTTDVIALSSVEAAKRLTTKNVD